MSTDVWVQASVGAQNKGVRARVCVRACVCARMLEGVRARGTWCQVEGGGTRVERGTWRDVSDQQLEGNEGGRVPPEAAARGRDLPQAVGEAVVKRCWAKVVKRCWAQMVKRCSTKVVKS